MKNMIKFLPVIVLGAILTLSLVACSASQYPQGQPSTVFVTVTKTPITSITQTTISTSNPIPANDSWVGDLSKVAGISLDEIPKGSYISDAYLGTRTLVIKGEYSYHGL
jgi:hypothetical protein